MGSTIWELFALEHEISPDGTLSKASIWDDTPYPLFDELENGQRHPRALFIDTEPGEIDELRKGSYKKLYSSNNVVPIKNLLYSSSSAKKEQQISIVEDLTWGKS